jgi:EAL and modified HD-GYP domain-containing signal transduction protein
MFARLFGLFRDGSKPARPKAAPSAEQEPVPPAFLRREALLDRRQQVAAYQFFLERPHTQRHWSAATEKFFDAALIGHFLDGRMQAVLGKRLAFLPLSPQGLDHPDLNRLQGENLILVFAPAPNVPLDRERVLASLTHMHNTGHKLACGQDLELRGLPEALEIASHIIFDRVAASEPTELLSRSRHLSQRYPEAQLVARQIDSQELYQACSSMGIALFQGGFVTNRPARGAKTLSPYRMVVVELLNGVRRQAGFDELAGIAWYDPALAYRLLRFVNSAAFGLREKIDNVKRAMTYVGRDELYRWLTLLLFSLGQETSPLDEALRENALVRARLAEQLAQGRLSAKECDEVFVVGILSVVDALFEMSMADALVQLTLPEAMNQALLQREGKYAPYLRLAIACEESDQDTIESLAAACGHDGIQVNQRHIEALAWALGFSEALEENSLTR